MTEHVPIIVFLCCGDGWSGDSEFADGGVAWAGVDASLWIAGGARGD
jgi:hypothetical protein